MSKASWRCPERGDGTLYGSVLTMLMSQSLDRNQKDIAEALGVSEKHLSQIVTGKVRLSWALADRWAHVNGCRIIAQPVFPDTSHLGRSTANKNPVGEVEDSGDLGNKTVPLGQAPVSNSDDSSPTGRTDSGRNEAV